MVAIVALVLAASFVYVSHAPLKADEVFHYTRVSRLLGHDFHLKPAGTTLPGYHFIVFLLASPFSAQSVVAIRLISFAISLVSILVFYLLAKQSSASSASAKTFQYIFFPLLYPLLFLIYTDVTSLLMVFLGIYLTIRQRYHVAGLVGIISWLVRQDNIVWVGFMFLLMAINVVGATDTEARPQSLLRDGRGVSPLRAILWNGSTYLLGFFLFTAFVIINRGVALGDVAMHPSFGLHAANIYCLLFTFFLMFLPLNISNAPKIASLMRRHRFAVLYIVGFFLLFMITFEIDHPYNTQQWFISNRILHFSMQNRLLKALFFLPVVYSVLSLLCTNLSAQRYYLIYPISILQMLPEWPVDPRYYLIPCLLFLAFKEEDSRPVRYLTCCMYPLLSGYLVESIVRYHFFL